MKIFNDHHVHQVISCFLFKLFSIATKSFVTRSKSLLIDDHEIVHV